MKTLRILAVTLLVLALATGIVTCLAENGIKINSVEITENETDSTVMDAKVSFTVPEGVSIVTLLLATDLEAYTTDFSKIIHIDQIAVPEDGVYEFSFYKSRVMEATGLDSINGVTLYLKMNYDNSEEDPAESQGSYEEAPEVTVKPGDVNNDGEINLKDVISIRRFVVGGYGVESNPAFDANNDNEINLKDVIVLRRYIVGGYGVEL